MADLSSPSLPLSRQQYTRAQKADIVEQSMAPSVSIASVAMAHGINANQLHKWRYLYKKGEFGPMYRQSSSDALELLPVRVELDVPLHKKIRPTTLSVTSLPEQHQGLFDCLVVCPISWLTLSELVGLIQNPDGVLPVISGKTDEFLENRPLLCWSTRTISQRGGRNQFLSRRHAQSPSHKCHPLKLLMGNKLREATASG